jgi:pimeloyl-ACP methyl ester carboxylesterase
MSSDDAGREPVAERFTTDSLGGVTLHALHHGSSTAPGLVLLHGGGANAHWWDHLAPTLAKDFHVVALDFRGHGDSDHPDALEPGAFQSDLEALLAHLDAPDAILIGHSMGAHVAFHHAGGGGRTRAVVALECSRGGGRSERRRARLALAARRTYASREEAVRRFQFLPAAPAAAEHLRVAIADHSVREESDGRFGYEFDARWFGLPVRTPPDLASIRCPVLLIRGAESRLLTADGAAELIERLPDARLVEIPQAGHNVQIERPGEVLAAVTTFLDALP